MSGGERRLALDDGSLVDVLDRLLDSGACVDGSVLITLADVDLVRLDLRLLLASVHTLERAAEEAREHAGERPKPAEVSTDASPPKAVPAPRAEPPRPQQARTGQPQNRQRRTEQPDTGPVYRPSAATPPGPPAVRTAADLPGAGTEEGDREAGVAGLVVFVVDLVRQLLERQALRRMDAGELTSTQVERLGRSLMALERQVGELTEFVAGRRRNKPDLSPFPGRLDPFPDHRNPVTEGRWQR